jgi:hypothetical protein
VSGGNTVETDTVCMIWGIACIAEKEDFFVIGVPTDGAWSGLFLLEFVFDPCIWVEFGYLFFVLDLIFGYDGSWRKRISILNYLCVDAIAPL